MQGPRVARQVSSGNGFRRALRGLAVLHPVPSLINAALVASLAILADGRPAVTVALVVAMLGFQFSIGSLNDLVDRDADRLTKPRKPIPAGLATVPIVVAIIIAGGAVGLAISAAFGTAVLLLGASGYATGVAYDIFMRRWGLAWMCYAAALPLLLAWAWIAAAAALPPGWPLILTLAALAGPAVHIANSLVDQEDDQRTGQTSLVTQLGPKRARWLLTALTGVIYALAWAALSAFFPLPVPIFIAASAATFGAVVGVVMSWQSTAGLREIAWLLQATTLATLAVAWLAAVPWG